MFVIEPKTPWKGQARNVMRTGKHLDGQMNEYYSGRQEESTLDGITVGMCIILCAVFIAAGVLLK